ncbi:hypothetical protein GYH30_009969 [Glycine max]|nr:hypothetical protein GYH30_009969 [Glycine max]
MRDQTTRDQNTCDMAARCGGRLVLLEAASPTHEHNELKRSLAACCLCQRRAREKLVSREYHKPQPTRSTMSLREAASPSENFRNFMVLA